MKCCGSQSGAYRLTPISKCKDAPSPIRPTLCPCVTGAPNETSDDPSQRYRLSKLLRCAITSGSVCTTMPSAMARIGEALDVTNCAPSNRGKASRPGGREGKCRVAPLSKARGEQRSLAESKNQTDSFSAILSTNIKRINE